MDSAPGRSGARALVLGLTTLRLLLGPILIWLVRGGSAGLPYVALCLLAFASDYFDGVLARRFGVDSALVRRYDSATDTVFFLCAAWSVWLLHAALVRPWLWMVAAVVGLEAARYLFDFTKFRREAAYHAWSAKLWGLSLFVALVALMGFGQATPWLPLTLALGILADAEGLAISLVLPVWTHDVKSVWHAWGIRAEDRRPGSIHLPDATPVLVLAPHPDDFDAIGVTLRRLHEQGHAIHLAVATSGASGVEDADCSPPTVEAKAALRTGEQRASCRFFGLPEERLRFLRLVEDDRGHPVVSDANVGAVRALLAEVRPAAVFLPHGHDTSVGHQRVYALLRAAASEMLRSQAATDGAAQGLHWPSPITVFLNRDPKTIAMRYDVATPFGEELAAWKATLLRFHQSQHLRNLRRRGHGFDERLLAMNRDSAVVCGVGEPYAEVFEVERLGESGRR
jgi:LmbE family N-acetylglucosaminyl deacetylase/phosphatidylglycerophosphate synthase